ncbi:VOC family protein [Paenibacillus oryzisoli]|uniref:VOC family protein n=1 Tax=Paenibacillus oryzisoli TaxID=1850517 RepID=UPI003D2E472B
MVQEAKPVIEHSIHFVFVPVSNMDRAVKFYSIILGLPLKPEPYGSLYNLDINSPNIVLDSNLEEDFVPCKHPLFSFKADNLEDARLVVTRAGGKVRDIVSFGDTSFFVFDDFDGNRIMIVNK